LECSRPVPADHSYLVVPAQPRSQVGTIVAVEDLNWTAGSDIDQHGAVVAVLAEGEVIDSEDRHWPGLRIR